jgi:hypothetical protein
MRLVGATFLSPVVPAESIVAWYCWMVTYLALWYLLERFRVAVSMRESFR